MRRVNCVRIAVAITAAHGFPRRVVPLRIQRSNGPKQSSVFYTKEKKKLCRFLPKISSTAKASRILDAPIKPDRHAEKTDEMMPITTNGAQILIY